jgi:uncharacterized membrane protein
MACRAKGRIPATSSGSPTREASRGASRAHYPRCQQADPARRKAEEESGMTVIRHSIDVDVSAHSAYEQWSRFEDLPRYMQGVHEVRRLDSGRLKWVADICGGRVEWYGKITDEVADRRLAWESDHGLVNSGVVTFKQLGPDKTRVTLEIEHDEERLAEAIAGKLASNRDDAAEGDLETFKEIIEDQDDKKNIKPRGASAKQRPQPAARPGGRREVTR